MTLREKALRELQGVNCQPPESRRRITAMIEQ
jgi:hypothetical protein